MVPWSPAPAQLTMAYSVCRGITRTNAKNFYYAFLVLPKRKRQAFSAVYAFMRRCDDIADDPGLSVSERRFSLDSWLDALHRAQQGQPTDDPILLALTDAQRRYSIPAGLLDELALGTAMDVVDPAADDQSASISPDSSPPADHGAIQNLRGAQALLLPRRIRRGPGLHSHLWISRSRPPNRSQSSVASPSNSPTLFVMSRKTLAWAECILPEEDLVKFGLSAAELLAAPDAARFRPLLALEAGRAREGYQDGDQLIPYISEDSQPALWVLINIYRRLLEKIAEREYDVFSGKISLTVGEKLRILGKGFLQRIT